VSNAVDDILKSLDMNQLADMVGADPNTVEQAAATALPALFGGLDANAQDPMGANSILQALGQHSGSLLDGGIDLGQIDPQDGAAITSHIFGNNEEAVYNQLGGYGAGGGLGGSLFKRLLPILAPIVMSYIMKHMTQRTGGAAGGSGGGLGDILGQVLGGGSAGQTQQSSGGGGLGDILGQVLGGSQQSQPQDTNVFPDEVQQPTQQNTQAGSGQQPNLDSILKDVLGGAASSTSNKTQSAGGGSIIGDILGGLLGGGRR